jgi:hypothetical protein
MHLDYLAPRDLRRTCAKLCRMNCRVFEQIQFLLSYGSALTIERYLDCKQNLGQPAIDRFGACSRLELLNHDEP